MPERKLKKECRSDLKAHENATEKNNLTGGRAFILPF
jgi:hypothetical protein